MPSNQADCCVLGAQKPFKSKQGAMGYRLWPHASVCLAVLFCLGVDSLSTDGAAPFTNRTVSHHIPLPSGKQANNATGNDRTTSQEYGTPFVNKTVCSCMPLPTYYSPHFS
jgi:hypothetical protein